MSELNQLEGGLVSIGEQSGSETESLSSGSETLSIEEANWRAKFSLTPAYPFPGPPVVPKDPGVVYGDLGLMDSGYDVYNKREYRAFAQGKWGFKNGRFFKEVVPLFFKHPRAMWKTPYGILTAVRIGKVLTRMSYSAAMGVYYANAVGLKGGKRTGAIACIALVNFIVGAVSDFVYQRFRKWVPDKINGVDLVGLPRVEYAVGRYLTPILFVSSFIEAFSRWAILSAFSGHVHAKKIWKPVVLALANFIIQTASSYVRSAVKTEHKWGSGDIQKAVAKRYPGMSNVEIAIHPWYRVPAARNIMVNKIGLRAITEVATISAKMGVDLYYIKFMLHV
jgi:hypothetical protein